LAESASDNAQAGGTVDVAVDSTVAATESSAADELGGKLVPEAGSEVDPIVMGCSTKFASTIG